MISSWSPTVGFPKVSIYETVRPLDLWTAAASLRVARGRGDTAMNGMVLSMLFVFVRLGEWCQKKKLFYSNFRKNRKKRGRITSLWRWGMVLKSNTIFLPYSWFSKKKLVFFFFCTSSLLPNTAIFHFHDYGRRSFFFPILLVSPQRFAQIFSSSHIC